MLVFRCECEQVLGVESEASQGGAGECPACGRVIRVPPVLVNAAGKLRASSMSHRAKPSGALLQISDSKSGIRKSGPFHLPPADPDIADLKVAEPETLTPISEHDGKPDVPVLQPPAAEPAQANESAEKKPSKAAPVLVQPDENDPAAATETRIDKKLGSTASAVAASRRKKADAAAAPKKSKSLLYILVVVVLIAAAATLYFLGFFGK